MSAENKARSPTLVWGLMFENFLPLGKLMILFVIFELDPAGAFSFPNQSSCYVSSVKPDMGCSVLDSFPGGHWSLYRSVVGAWQRRRIIIGLCPRSKHTGQVWRNRGALSTTWRSSPWILRMPEKLP